MGLPEGEVRGEGEEVEVAELRAGVADLHEAAPRRLETIEIVLGVEEGNRLGGSTGGARHENGAVLPLEPGLHSGLPAGERPEDRRRPPREDLLVGNEHEVPGPGGGVLLGNEAPLRGKRNAFQIGERPDPVGIDALLAEDAAVVGGEWDDVTGKEAPQGKTLAMTQFLRVEAVPGSGEWIVHQAHDLASLKRGRGSRRGASSVKSARIRGSASSAAARPISMYSS